MCDHCCSNSIHGSAMESGGIGTRLGLIRCIMVLFHCVFRHGSMLCSGPFELPLQFSTALEWAGLFTCRYSCATSTAVTSTWTRHKHTTKEHIDGMVFLILGMWMFLIAMEKPMRLLGIYPPAAETVVAVPQTVEEDGRDVRAGVLHYLNTIHVECSVKWIIIYLWIFQNVQCIPCFFFICVGLYHHGINHLSFSRGSLRAHTIIHL